MKYIEILKQNALIVNTLLIAFIGYALASAAIIWSYQHGTILAYGDAEAHLNIAKRVVDSLTPGFSQLGGVWLPLPHVLMVPLVWNDFLWRTGLAGSLVSGVAFIWAAVVMYRLGYLVTKSHWASFVAPFVFMLNPNALYLMTTPMSEILLFATLVSSMYFFIKWVYKDQFSSLILMALFACLATLSRYDGWFLVIAEIIGIIFFSIVKRTPRKKAEGGLIIFCTLAFLGIGLWLLWNWAIFGNPLYFANSDYGSKSQQMWFYERGYLPTYKNLPLSFLYFSTDTYLILGAIISISGLVSLLYYFGENIFNWVRLKKMETMSLLILLLPLFFYSVSLYTGQASQILPTYAQPWYEWTMSNVRYGVHMLIPAGIFMAYFARKNKILALIFIGLTVLQLGLFLYKGDVIAYQDGVGGLSSQKISKGPDAPPVEKWMSENYSGGLVLMDDYRRPISPVESGVPMNSFISVGNKPYWEDSLINVAAYADWVIIQKAETDAVWKNLKDKKGLEQKFTLAYKSGNIFVYKRIHQKSKFLNTDGQDFIINGKKIKLKGVNIYDLLQNDKSQIDSDLQNLHKNNANVIRIWGFNKEGVVREEELSNLDYILTKAKENQIHVIIVFGNQWDDYGGKNAFTDNPDDFFTNNNSINAFEDHVDMFLTRKNSINNTLYINDPTIAAWELLNEPRVEYDVDSSIIKSWVAKVGGHISELDQNHLVTVGGEGFTGGRDERAYRESHGANLDEICSLSVVDFCSAHLFPKYLKQNGSQKELEILVNDWQRITNKYKKPLYLGEIGFDLNVNDSDPANYGKREEFFSRLFTIANEKNIGAIVLWNLAKEHDEYYSLSFNNESDRRILEKLGN